MLVAAALVPDTVLLLPGACGHGQDDAELVALRTATADAVSRAVSRAHRVVVVAPGPVDRSVVGTIRAGAAAAGVPDHLLVGDVPEVGVGPVPGAPPRLPGAPGASACTGIRLALEAGVRAADLHVVEVAPGHVAPLRSIGASTTAAVPTALVVVGSGAARHGPDAPLPSDDRAAGLERELLASLRKDGPAARDALATLDVARAGALGVTGWAPWQVLVGALDACGRDLCPPDVVHAAVWRGAAHAAVTWEVAP